jgi:hypothetical protein
MLENVGNRLIAALPKDIETQLLRRLRGKDAPTDEAPEDRPPADGGATNTTAPEESYGNNSRAGLNQLIRNSSGAGR